MHTADSIDGMKVMLCTNITDVYVVENRYRFYKHCSQAHDYPNVAL